MDTYDIGEFSKRRPIIAILSAILTILGVWWTAIQLINYYANVVYTDQIYISLWETGKKVPINEWNLEIPTIVPIKPNEPVILRFILTQNNVNSPQITTILLTFPDDARVEPISYEGWTWIRNNDKANRYFLNFSNLQVLASGTDYNLPAFSVTFKSTGLLSFSYQINGNKINPIRKEFTINTERNYDEEEARKLNPWTNESSPDTFKIFVIDSGNDANSVTPMSDVTSRFDVKSSLPDTISPDDLTMGK